MKTQLSKSGIIALALLTMLFLSTAGLAGYHEAFGPIRPNITVQQPNSSSPVKQYLLPSPNSYPNAIVYGPNQALWFVQFNSGQIGELFLVNSTIREFNITENGANPASLAVDGSGNVWFTDQKIPSIWEYKPALNTFRQYNTTVQNSTPVFVLPDTSNHVWYTDTTANYIGDLAPATGTIARYSLPTSNSGPAELAFQNGTSYLWITESFTNKIARFDTSTNSFQEFVPPFSMLSPVGLGFDDKQDLWISEHRGSSVIELVSSNSTWRKYPTSQPASLDLTAPATITLDKAGRVWFVEHFSNKVGRLDPQTRVINEFGIPATGPVYSLRSAVDPSGNFWFTEGYDNKIGMIQYNSTPAVLSSSVLSPISVSSGQSVNSAIILENNESSSINVQLNVTSTFTSNAQTSGNEVSLSNYTLTLAPNTPTSVEAKITPDCGLSPGFYAAGVVASYGNYSVIGVIFLQVQSGTCILNLLLTYLPFIIIAAGAVILFAFVLIRKRGPSTTAATNVKPPVATILFIALTFLVLSVRVIPDSFAKCIGLPPPPPGSPPATGPDYFGVALDVGSLAFFAVIIYLLLRDRWKKKPRGPDQPPPTS